MSAVESRRQVAEMLHRVLGADGAPHRGSAVRAVGRMCDRDAVPALLALLRDADPDVRVDAAVALGNLKAEEAVAALVENVERDPAGEVRIEAVKALGRIGSRQAVEPLIRCFEAEGYPELDRLSGSAEYGPWFEVQRRALEALGDLGDERAVRTAIGALENDDCEDLHECAIRVLARLNAGKAREFLVAQLKAGQRLARCRAARALATLPELRANGGGELPAALLVPLAGALTDPDPDVRVCAAQALAGSENPMVVVSLSLLLNDPDIAVRSEAAALLGRMHGKAALERLHAMLAESDPALRRRVAQALGEIGDGSSVVHLSPLLDAADRDLAFETIGALGKIGVPDQQPKLAAILAEANNHHTVRAQAAWALGRLGLACASNEADGQAIDEVLGRALADPDERVAQAALCALAEADPALADGRLASVMRGTSDGLRVLAARLLGGLACAGPRAEEPLLEACEAGDASLRREALVALGRLGGRRAVAALVAGLDAGEKEVRLAALDALAALEEEHAAGGKLSALLEDPDPGVRVSVVRALARGRGEQVARGLCRALGDSHLHVCRAALVALSPGAYTPECRDRVVALMFRFGGELRAQAACTLRRLNDFSVTGRLLDTAADPAGDATRWIAIETLGELFAKEPA